MVDKVLRIIASVGGSSKSCSFEEFLSKLDKDADASVALVGVAVKSGCLTVSIPRRRLWLTAVGEARLDKSR